MTVAEDEMMKSAAHGILLGCTLPVFLFNLKAGNWFNTLVYGAVICFEGVTIKKHVQAAQSSSSSS